MDLDTYLQERRTWIERALARSIQDGSIPETLRKAMLYSLEGGGKRLRPILVIAGAECVGGGADQVMAAAIAMEMIHTFSLIHDDLPAMDDDSLRRGRPTSHKVFGDACAILAGDALLAEAFYVMADACGTDPHVLLAAIRGMAAAAGGRGMTGGQQMDLESTGKPVGEAELTRLHLYKTGALIKCAVTTGARLAGASDEQIASLARYGEATGLAFQITDDILDVEGDQELLGKDVGSDRGKGKSTYPSVIGIEASRRQAKALVDQAVSSLDSFGVGAEPLRSIAGYMIERKR